MILMINLLQSFRLRNERDRLVMKHKTYFYTKNQNIDVLISKIEAYLTKQCDLEIILSSVQDNNEHLIIARTKNDFLKRLIGQNKIICVGIKDNNTSMEVRVGNGSWLNRAVLVGAGLVFLPFLPVALGLYIAGDNAQENIFNAIWTIIDHYMN